ncbi:hypothetical protein Trydic_g21587 [Trypoxylus dichotomus]
MIVDRMMGSKYQDVAPSPSSSVFNSLELPATQSTFGSGEFSLIEWECRLLLRYDGTHSSLQLLGPPSARGSFIADEDAIAIAILSLASPHCSPVTRAGVPPGNSGVVFLGHRHERWSVEVH